jgi:periplasmic divalent cation tolerance protein
MTDYVQVMTTVEKEEDARRIGDLLVESRLAACVQIVGPMTSIYRWQGAMESAAEFLLLVKSHRDLFSQLAEVITANHPYEVPEILAVPVCAGGTAYLEWLAQELRQGHG